jgi:zinc transport system substrate-binding protein
MFISSRSARLVVLPTTAALAAISLSACSSSESTASDDAAPLKVVAAFYPLQYAAERVGGDAVEVTNLTPAGAEPHDLELTPQQVAAISEADLVLYVGGFMGSVDDAVAQEAKDTALDVGADLTTLDPPPSEIEEAKEEGEEPPTSDPHIWLDPTLMTTMSDRIAERLGQISEADAATFTKNQEALDADLGELTKEWDEGTATCESRDLVVSHEAFGYLGKRFDFEQIGLSGLSPEAEPSPKRLAEVSDFVEQNDVTTIYFETLVDPKVAETIAQETGAKTAPLDPLEGLEEGSDEDYLSIMRANLAEVVKGQRCT